MEATEQPAEPVPELRRAKTAGKGMLKTMGKKVMSGSMLARSASNGAGQVRNLHPHPRGLRRKESGSPQTGGIDGSAPARAVDLDSDFVLSDVPASDNPKWQSHGGGNWPEPNSSPWEISSQSPESTGVSSQSDLRRRQLSRQPRNKVSPTRRRSASKPVRPPQLERSGTLEWVCPVLVLLGLGYGYVQRWAALQSMSLEEQEKAMLAPIFRLAYPQNLLAAAAVGVVGAAIVKAVFVMRRYHAHAKLCQRLANPSSHEAQDVNWEQKIRIVVGNTGKAKPFAKDGELDKSDSTTSFRDALLLYATRRWIHVDKKSPAKTLSLNLIDFGETEVQEGDGKTLVEQRREPLYLPLDDEDGDGFALSDSGDIRLVIVQPTANARPRSRKKKKKGATKAKESNKDPDTDEEEEEFVFEDEEAVCLYLDVYGERPFERVQKLLERAMQEMSSPGQHAKKGATEGKSSYDAVDDPFGGMFGDDDEPHGSKNSGGSADKQLFWFDLKGWNSKRNDGVIEPIYNKKPIHGTKIHQRLYHQSFFHPDKDRLIGIPGYSLLDKFENSEGAYAIPGVQRKLNFLMHGPPGTGKSKFVRTAAMYLQRHVVSFSLGQVETEGQWLTLLDSLKTITDDHKKPANDMTFDDVVFVIEELDTDPRELCLQRVEGGAPSKDAQEADDEDSDEDDSNKKRGKKKKKGKGKKDDNASFDPPLSLGAILRQLDGGSEAPGRLILMTTNREEMLDAAFKRPGRVKKVRMENLAFREFKLMMLHFLPQQETGSSTGHQLPTVELWTEAIEELAQLVMKDFDLLQSKRNDDLDKRGLGLSPAMLEDCCINAESLQDLFNLIRRELDDQWRKADLPGEPHSSMPIQLWDWHVHSLRVAVMYHLKGDELRRAGTLWPGKQVDDLVEGGGMEAASNVSDGGKVAQLVQKMLQDEATLNNALEECRYDYSHHGKYQELGYRSEIWLGGAIFDIKSDNCTLERCLDAVREQLEDKWVLATETEDRQIKSMLEVDLPPSNEEVIAFVANAASN